LDKSVGLLGLGRKALCKISVDPNMHIDARKLELQIRADLRAAKKPFCIVGTLGTTNSGAIDDIVTLAVIAKKYNIWLHVDGAYGAGAMLSDKHPEIMRGSGHGGFAHCGSPQMDGDALRCRSDPHTAMPKCCEKAFGVHTPYMPKVDGATLVDNISSPRNGRADAMRSSYGSRCARMAD